MPFRPFTARSMPKRRSFGASGFKRSIKRRAPARRVAKRSFLKPAQFSRRKPSANPPRLKRSAKATGGRPSFSHVGAGVRVQHREYITDIVSSGTTGKFKLNVQEGINAGNKDMQPWLAGIAKNFQRYMITDMTVHYNSTSGSVSTTQALGEVMMAYHDNVSHIAPATKADMLILSKSVSVVASANASFKLPCAPKWRYVRGTNEVAFNAATHGTRDTYDDGMFYLATAGIPVADVAIGELWVSYNIVLDGKTSPNTAQYGLGDVGAWVLYETRQSRNVAIGSGAMANPGPKFHTTGGVFADDKRLIDTRSASNICYTETNLGTDNLFKYVCATSAGSDVIHLPNRTAMWRIQSVIMTESPSGTKYLDSVTNFGDRVIKWEQYTGAVQDGNQIASDVGADGTLVQNHSCQEQAELANMFVGTVTKDYYVAAYGIQYFKVEASATAPSIYLQSLKMSWCAAGLIGINCRVLIQQVAEMPTSAVNRYYQG
jgi:hypothetical protein